MTFIQTPTPAPAISRLVANNPDSPAPAKPGDWCGTPVPPGLPAGPEPFVGFRNNLHVALRDAQLAADALKLDPSMPVRPETPIAASLRAARASDNTLSNALNLEAPKAARDAALVARRELASGIALLQAVNTGLVDLTATRSHFNAAVNWMNVADGYVTYQYGV